MTTFVWLMIAAVILPASYFAWSLVAVDRSSGRLIRTRLNAVAQQQAKARSKGPGLLLRLSRSLTPDKYITRLDRILANAGRPASMPLDRLLAIKPLAALGGGLAALLLGGTRSPQGILLTLALASACYFLPDLLVYNNGTKRQARIQKDLPNVLDQLLVSVEAGLGFEAALSRVGASGNGPLADELVRTLQDIQAGRSRKEAYKALAERCTVPDVRSFVGAIVQADIQGLSIARILKPQAEQMRIKRRLRAEEKAMKLPVAVVFPLILFIFPPLFIIILGPAVINAISTFAKL
ncbi:type II secretion system F family protein [Paenarthrobacter sp. AR 02]|uniref:type II secretion system F family protein n=1 Tax=Paenarthrobacter sp. AR 02 TaxID=2899821 RepID=UPI001F3DE66A|nr:type II secretion system F family protein [Paenarthrobacter sp. AR 02]MCF3137758.1 type II secretion system F family protein [Paenarthrobacter sp. AR 02]